ncbi:MAG: hypothetical protein J6Y91_02115 [Alphaproteobacteria bacterium]|nr:hypothetical protein [Alphaproteobacteria bacterium]
MDILYYIGSGSHHNNQELRYSLRALEHHCQDLGKVWIVGNKPHFLNDNIHYLWVPDDKEWWKNAYCKTRAAIDAGISEDFLLMNDDFYMLKDFYAAQYPYYHKGDIMEKASNAYQQVIVNTRRILESSGKPYKHYGVHCPMRINVCKYKELDRFYNHEYEDMPVSARCLYGNLFCRGRKVSDNKCDVLKVGATGCYSSRNWAPQALNKLQEIFPQPSRWEKEE